MEELLSLGDAQVLELGCGTARMTREMVERFAPRQVLACEVDKIQHQKNLAVTDLPGVTFVYGGAEKIDRPDNDVDVVIMLKSLHHVPVELMDQAMAEIARVLRPGGLAYISEPIFAGDFNEILRLFNDEQQVRQAAFQALVRAVERGLLELRQQRFFLSSSRFADFAEFEQRILRVTHTNHQVDDGLYHRVKEAFQAHLGEEGAEFLNPMRVDLLAKPGGVG
jgi:ubiquinone/menaquinone biosynthesis C-methylase UbiE